MQCNIRRSYRANNANCNGYHRRLVTRSATAFTLGPVRKFFYFFFIIALPVETLRVALDLVDLQVVPENT